MLPPIREVEPDWLGGTLGLTRNVGPPLTVVAEQRHRDRRNDDRHACSLLRQRWRLFLRHPFGDLLEFAEQIRRELRSVQAQRVREGGVRSPLQILLRPALFPAPFCVLLEARLRLSVYGFGFHLALPVDGNCDRLTARQRTQDSLGCLAALASDERELALR
jgi:hypothetical protein